MWALRGAAVALLCGALSLPGARAGGAETDESVAPPPPGVTELTLENFDTLVTKDGTWLIEFFGPSCGFCKMLEPTWAQLAKEVTEDEIDMKVGRVNVRAHSELSRRFNIGPLPGIKLVKKGVTYTLPDARRTRTVDEYIEYSMETFEEVEKAEAARVADDARKQAQTEAASKVVKLTAENFESLVTEGSAWLIEFYGPKCGYCKKLAPTWEELGALVNSDPKSTFKVAKVDAVEAHEYTRHFKANPWPSIKLFRNNKVYTFPDSRDFSKTLQDYVDYATKESLYKREADDAFTPDFIKAAEAVRKAEVLLEKARLKKAQKAKEAVDAARAQMKPKLKAHEEL